MAACTLGAQAGSPTQCSGLSAHPDSALSPAHRQVLVEVLHHWGTCRQQACSGSGSSIRKKLSQQASCHLIWPQNHVTGAKSRLTSQP